MLHPCMLKFVQTPVNAADCGMHQHHSQCGLTWHVGQLRHQRVAPVTACMAC